MNNIKRHDEQLTLGEFIDCLTPLARHNADAHVEFDFCGLVPAAFASSRGDYSELALGWADPRGSADKARRAREEWPEPTLRTLLDRANAAVGATFPGWKGGEYVATKRSLLWVDNPGEWTSTIIFAVEIRDGAAIIHTRRVA